MKMTVFFKVFAFIVLIATALGEPTEVNYLRGILDLLFIRIMMIGEE